MILSILALVVVACMFMVFGFIAYDHILVAGVPFRRLREATIHEILKSMRLKEGVVLYDLGCGDGRVLIEAAKLQPKGRYIGVERAFVPYMLAKYRTKNYKSITIQRKNVLAHSFEDADIVFVYLMPALLTKLLPKFKQSIKNHKTVISVQFQIPGQSHQKRQLLTHRSQFAKDWYVY